MTLQSSGQISLSDIATEYGGAVPHSLSEYLGKGNAPPTGEIQLAADFYGTSNRVAINLTISASTNNYDVFANRGGSYVAGSSDITLTINSGVYVGSGATNTYALTVPSSFSAGDTVTIVNRGIVIGKGGNGGVGGYQGNNATAGAVGGNAFLVQRATTVQNIGTFAGGGGGGGGGGARTVTGSNPNPNPKNPPIPFANYYAGGSGGGGAGRNVGSGGAATAPNGAAGSNGTNTGGGAGGVVPNAGNGGAGGGRGANGGAGVTPTQPGTNYNAAGGGTRGYYTNGNPNVTWSPTGTRQGQVA